MAQSSIFTSVFAVVANWWLWHKTFVIPCEDSREKNME